MSYQYANVFKVELSVLQCRARSMQIYRKAGRGETREGTVN